MPDAMSQVMTDTTYAQRRGQLEVYFDRTAVDAWERLTSTAKVSRIRETVRAGRDQMREVLLSYLPFNLRGRRVLDAGCGTGALSVEAAWRGAEVVAVDLSPRLIALARERTPRQLGEGRIDFRVGDLLDPSLGSFDHVIGMDSLIHYRAHDVVGVLASLTARTRVSLLFTFAPKTPLLTVMHAVGLLFPRGNRAPAIVPVAEPSLHKRIAEHPSVQDWRPGRTQRVASGFYTSQALELVRR